MMTHVSKSYRASIAKAYVKMMNGSSDDDSSGHDKRKSIVVVSERMTCL